MKTLKDFNFKNKRVLVRSDLNVPLGDRGNILDDFRIRQTAPTIKYLIKKGAKVILISHLGRPAPIFSRKIGEFPISNFQFSNHKKHSLKPIAFRFGKLLKKKVKFLEGCVGGVVEREIRKMKSKDIVLLENLRFHKEEEEADGDFAQGLARLGDIYINDAFGASHRNHASIASIPKYLPSGMGLLLEKEIKVLTKLIENPEKPLVVVVGGAKAETKTKLINRISEIADFVLIGGLINRGIKEKRIILNHPQKIIMPVDAAKNSKDIGEKTIRLFKEKIAPAKTVFWNGPLGQIEKKEFSAGSEEIAKAIIQSGSFSIAGGGETVEFINRLGLSEKFSHLSTGGGAMLAFLSGEKLPGIAALK